MNDKTAAKLIDHITELEERIEALEEYVKAIAFRQMDMRHDLRDQMYQKEYDNDIRFNEVWRAIDVSNNSI